MAISSAMYAAVTGLSALGAGMQTISNNIANVNTVGFKAGRTNYEDLISQNYFSGGRVNQRGCGVKVSTIQSLFSQGTFMSSGEDTDMAIAGEGFFSVRNTVTNEVMYTRAGLFTLRNDGYLEDPSGNILQGWQMSIPKPGESASRLGAPTDIKITVLNAPPVATSQIKIVTNLNADDENAYKYEQDKLAIDYADSQARPAAEEKRTETIQKIYVEEVGTAGYDGNQPPAAAGAANAVRVTFPENVPPMSVTGTNKAYQEAFIEEFQRRFGDGPANPVFYRVVTDDTELTEAQQALGLMTVEDFESIAEVARAKAMSKADAEGLEAFTTAYDSRYQAAYEVISQLDQWKLEGNGFADAWNANNNPPIDPASYTHPEPITIYDSLGSEHKLMIYYQKNPIMENVWDYIVTCDPIEDARKDGNNALLFSDQASFTGLIQKGKITFSGDGSDRHGGVIKDIEAQNLDLSASTMAVINVNSDGTVPEKGYGTGTTTLMKTATIGGYYNGSPTINPQTGVYEATDRTYTIKYGALDETAYNSALSAWQTGYEDWCQQNGIDPSDPAKEQEYVQINPKPDSNDFWTNMVPSKPPCPGLTWTDGTTTKYIQIQDVNHAGPYDFGSGLTITFNTDLLPLNFGQPGADALTFEATSEQVAWKTAAPNEQGYFDFDVAFVQSASMALHPPYPTGMPTLYQTIAFDMGAKYNITNPKWVLDELSTSQYAAENSTAFSGQDGYPAGSLQRVSIGEDGVITGVYSNGRHQPLYQVGLTRFLNPWGLSKEGDNLFSATRYSGEGALNPPGYGGTGTILGNFLEQSNVDLAEEIVSMIVTQRGFQANSKTVTTTDSMLEEIIHMKR